MIERQQFRDNVQYIETDRHVYGGDHRIPDEATDECVAETLFIYWGQGSSVRSASEDYNSEFQLSNLNAQTGIDHDESSHWRKLERINQGVWETYHESRKRESDNRKLVRSYGFRVNLPESYIEVAEKMLEAVNIGDFGSYPKEAVVLGVLCKADQRRISHRIRDPSNLDELRETHVSNRREFRKLMEAVDIDEEDLRNIRGLLSKKIDEEDTQVSVQGYMNMMN